jgi:CDGSH-type Zn-finger protein
VSKSAYRFLTGTHEIEIGQIRATARRHCNPCRTLSIEKHIRSRIYLIKEYVMPASIQITATSDGPNMVTGAVELLWPSGHVISQEGEADGSGAIFLCRCGASNNKPFCDNSHLRIGFKSTEGDATAIKPKQGLGAA